MNPERALSRLRPKSASFPCQARLRKPSDFRWIISNSNRSADGFFTVLVASTEDGALARLGLAISKKCAGSAVERNRLKRVVRESFRIHRDLLAAVDIVVMCRPKAAQTSNAELMVSLLKHWNKVHQSRQCAS